MTYRKLRQKALPAVVDFLDRNYPCKCPVGDECGGSYPEAEALIEVVLDEVYGDIRRGVLEDLDRRLEPEAKHERADGIWAAQDVIAEMLKED